MFRSGHVSYCDVTSPGESAFVAPDGTRSPHARDQLGLYAAFGCKPEWLEPADVERHAASTEHLRYLEPDIRPDRRQPPIH